LKNGPFHIKSTQQSVYMTTSDCNEML
jgi:hypothetical protein